MIDFARITKTLDGMDCRYIHERESNGKRIHVFALFNEVGERYEYYNQHGKRLKWSGSRWELEQDGKWKIYEPKIVEVTTWDVYWLTEIGRVWADKYQIEPSISHLKSHELEGTKQFLKIVKVTEFIEVPNE